MSDSAAIEAMDQTWLDLAREIGAEYGHHPTDQQLDGILWEFTCFPLGTVEQVTEHLREFFAASVPVGDSPKETDLCIDCEEVPPRPLLDPIPEGAEVMLSESIAGRALYCEGCFEEADAMAEGEQ